MTEWSDYTKNHKQIAEAGGKEPSLFNFCVIKIFENGEIIVLLLLVFLFTCLGCHAGISDPSKQNWSFHAAELCLGVLLGRYSIRKEK